MLNNGNNKSCGFDELMVSYIYDEITTADRRKFEMHLVDCSACTEEFAEISGARFSIFEWQKEEFSELPTPEIVIPYREKSLAATEETGFFAGLRAFFSGFGMPIGVAAGLLVVIGIGFAAFTLMPGDKQIASNTRIEQPKLPQNSVADVPQPRAEKIEAAKAVTADAVDKISSREIKPAKAVLESKRSRPARQLTAETAERVKPPQMPVKKAPALSNFDEASDRSLRLTDLFDDEVGSIR